MFLRLPVDWQGIYYYLPIIVPPRTRQGQICDLLINLMREFVAKSNFSALSNYIDELNHKGPVKYIPRRPVLC